MFPAGAPGIALLLLRISLAAAILDGCSDFFKPSFTPLICVAVAVHCLLLCFGFLTPVASIIACVLELTHLYSNGYADWRFLALASLNAAAIGLLGPGAYSVDARLFGRRVVVIPPGGRPDRH